MGALAPVSPWIPEDDLRLRNAVEAGASLESLAKGAVQFSRRFTVQELQNRWHSLLYDPVVSAEASARMIEFEHSTSTLSKTNRFEEKCVSGKRKAGSVRKCYYAMRKRICNVPFESTNLSFLVAPGNDNCNGNRNELPPANFMFDDPISNHFGVQDSNFGIMHHAFPQFATNSAAGGSDDVTVHAFCTEYQDQIEDIPVDQINMHEQISHNFEENLPLCGSCSGVEELGPPKELPVCDIFETDDIEATPSTIYNQNNCNIGNMCPGFGGNPVFNSSITDCDASFQNLGYSSPAQMPIWSTFEGISAPTMPDVRLNESKQPEGDAFAFPDNHDAINSITSGYDVVHSESKLENQMQCENIKNTKPTSDDYLTELSDALLNFADEEELLFLDDDGKDGIDKSYIDGLSSLLLDSPNVDDMPNISETKVSVAAAPDEFLTISGGACSRESDECTRSHYVVGHGVHSSEGHMLPSSSAVHRQFPELHNEVICCTLNTEDTEIPCNDDVFLPIHMPSTSLSSVTELKFHEVNKPTSSLVRKFSVNQKTNAGGQSLIKREGKNPEQVHLSSQMLGSHLLPEMGRNHSVGDLGVKFELPNSDCSHIAFKSSSIACEGPNQTSLETASPNTLLPATLKVETMEIEQVTHLTYNSADSHLEKPVHGFNSLVSYPQRNISCNKQEVDAPAALQNHQAFHAQLSCAEMDIPEPEVNLSPSEQEEFPSECDDGVPYFSDVEAMILDMDLSPDDQDLYTSREVSRYQHEDSKRAIIRLEQAAHSSMQRVIASRGAFAVLCGRHSKHYIKRPEVLIGRATEDVNVDIDLGREGRANKISRRQAIIKMDKDGSFHLKNLGKCSIFVNNKEVAPKQCLALTSSCLLEIRGMPFIFETNQTCVKQYVDSISKESQTQEHKIEHL